MMFEEMLNGLPDASAGDAEMSPSAIRERLRKPGRILKAVRELRGEEIEVTALRSGIPVARLVRLESDADRPARSELLQLAEHHGGDPHVLLETFGYAD